MKYHSVGAAISTLFFLATHFIWDLDHQLQYGNNTIAEWGFQFVLLFFLVSALMWIVLLWRIQLGAAIVLWAFLPLTLCSIVALLPYLDDWVYSEHMADSIAETEVRLAAFHLIYPTIYLATVVSVIGSTGFIIKFVLCWLFKMQM